MKVYIESMGCDSNIADSNKVRKFLKENKIEIISDYKKANFIILMTCGFNQIILRDNINRLKELKKTGAKIILGGCIPKIEPELCKLADYSFNPREFKKLNEIFNISRDIERISPEFNREKKKIIRIATGCAGKCAYCVIRVANGRTKSRSIEDITKDIKEGIKEGYANFIFTSEDTGSWGQDINSNIPNLIREVISLNEDFKVALTTFNPQWFIKYPELYELFKSEKIDKKVYLSLQSGSNRVLKLMQRDYSVEQYTEIFNRLKKEIPEIKIQVDVLVGFPSETEEDFEKTFNLIKKLDIYFLQVFAYTDMKNTLAEKLKLKVPFEIAKERAQKLINFFLEKHKEEKRNLVHTNLKIQ